MPKRCAVCDSAARPLVELGGVHGLSASVLAGRYGLSRFSIARHLRNHVSPAAAAAILVATKPSAIDLEQLTESEGSALLGNLVAQRARLTALGQRAAEDAALAIAIAAEKAITSNLEVTGKLLQRFVLRTDHRHLHVLADPRWIQLRQRLSATLRRFPDAAMAVARDLAEIEGAAAKEILAGKPPALVEHVEVSP